MNSKGSILVVDDERSMQEFLEIFFRREGFDVAVAGGVQSALVALENGDFDIMISDLQMPDGSGLDLLRAAVEVAPETVGIVITAFASADSAIAAMKAGAYDYVTKPFKVDEIRLVVEKALEKKLLARDNRRLRSELRSQVRNRSLVGNSEAMQRIFEFIEQVADARTHVLVTGESGTGKELVARAIHDQSARSPHPFVAVNCGAIPENLLESELFGHMKGSFTGAYQNKEGLFESAEGGTLFLDEVAELPGTLQVKLLRVIQDKAVRRVGGTSDRVVDVRILSATNKQLEDEVSAGRFREDLYYRLNVIQISVPPLRDRREDISLLVTHFMEKYNRELSRSVETITEGAMARLMAYHYPGNVRELENVVERAVALSRGPVIPEEALPPTLLRRPEAPLPTEIPAEGVNLEVKLADYERALLTEAMHLAGGVKKHAAQLLRISFRSFRYRFEKLGLDVEEVER